MADLHMLHDLLQVCVLKHHQLFQAKTTILPAEISAALRSWNLSKCNCSPTTCFMLAQARARLRELHADILAGQLAAAEAGVDVRAEMGWDREERELGIARSKHLVSVQCCPRCDILLTASSSPSSSTSVVCCSLPVCSASRNASLPLKQFR